MGKLWYWTALTILRALHLAHRVKQKVVERRLWRQHTAETGRTKPEWMR